MHATPVCLADVVQNAQRVYHVLVVLIAGDIRLLLNGR
jgi:hypothetical protein